MQEYHWRLSNQTTERLMTEEKNENNTECTEHSLITCWFLHCLLPIIRSDRWFISHSREASPYVLLNTVNFHSMFTNVKDFKCYLIGLEKFNFHNALHTMHIIGFLLFLTAFTVLSASRIMKFFFSCTW